MGQINVGAMNQYNLDYSLSCIGDHIDVAAPGEDIYSSVPAPDNYTIMHGTSMAAPHVAGLASLLLAVKPWLHADDVRQLIRLTATDMTYPPASPGYDINTGMGRINAGEAVSKLLYPNELRHEEAIGGLLGSEDWVGDMMFSYPPPGLDANTWYEAHRFPVERDVSFPPVFESIEAVWGRGTHTIGYSTEGSTSGFPSLNYGMGWCEPVPGTITPSGCRLRTYVYRIDDYEHGQVIWAPTMAGSVKFAYSVLGEATVSGVERDEEQPSSGFVLVNDNPLTKAGAFKLTLSRTALVTMDLFDVAGRKVKSLYAGQLSPGQHELRWDARSEQGRRMPAGLYFAKVRVGDAHLVRKIVLVP